MYTYSYLLGSAVWLRLFSYRIFSLKSSPPFQTWGGLPFYLLDTSHWCKHILTAPTFRPFSGGNISTRKTWRWYTLPDPGRLQRTQQDCGSVWPDSACSKLDPPLFQLPLLGGNRWQTRLKKQNCFMYICKELQSLPAVPASNGKISWIRRVRGTKSWRWRAQRFPEGHMLGRINSAGHRWEGDWSPCCCLVQLTTGRERKEIKGLHWEKRRKLQSSVIQRKVDINDKTGVYNITLGFLFVLTRKLYGRIAAQICIANFDRYRKKIWHFCLKLLTVLRTGNLFGKGD